MLGERLHSPEFTTLFGTIVKCVKQPKPVGDVFYEDYPNENNVKIRSGRLACRVLIEEVDIQDFTIDGEDADEFIIAEADIWSEGSTHPTEHRLTLNGRVLAKTFYPDIIERELNTDEITELVRVITD